MAGNHTRTTQNPGNLTFIKFPMPANLNDYPYTRSYLQSLGGNVTDTAAVMIELNAARTDWDETSQLRTASSCDLTQHIGSINMDNVQQVRINDTSSYIASQRAAGASQIGISIKNTVSEAVSFSSRTGTWAPGLYLKW